MRLIHCVTCSSVTVIPSALIVPLSTAISRVFNAVRASPPANSAIARICSSLICTLLLPKPSGDASACLRSVTILSVVSGFKTNTLHRERRAPLTSKEGFSVVAPIKMMLPFST